MFRRAISVAGNYAEIYAQFLAPISPLRDMNTINNGSTGLLYSDPFGDISHDRGSAPLGGSMQSILDRGFLRCGIRIDCPGFVSKTENKTTLSALYQGIEIDYCHAISACMLQGQTDNVVFVELDDQADGVAKLADGEVDVVVGATWNLHNDVREPSTGQVQGFSFSQPYFLLWLQ